MKSLCRYHNGFARDCLEHIKFTWQCALHHLKYIDDKRQVEFYLNEKNAMSVFIGTWAVYFSVTIVGAPFKGFFLQARDTNTNEWIGSWTRTPNTNIHSECSAVTHADPRDKEQATFIWNAPANGRGSVYFT